MKVFASLTFALLFGFRAISAQPPAAVRTITYETGPCFGRCPVYRVTVSADGVGRFEGRRFTAVLGIRNFRLNRPQYRAFAARLDPLRPAEAERRYRGPPLCRQMATDQGSVQVTWHATDGPHLLDVYFGCDMAQNRPMFDRLIAARGMLPIGDFIGRAR